jgi:nucleoside-diphosphate-sugar epimerase
MITNFFITGYNGFLGNIIGDVLSKNGQKTQDINVLSDKKLDITKPFKLAKPEGDFVIIHSAGKAHSIPKTKEEKKLFYDINDCGTQNLCNALKPYLVSLKGFVFISTVSVYGVDNGRGINENFPLNAQSPYGVSKIKAEKYLTQWGIKNNVPVLILRLPLISGPNPPGNLGKMIKGIDTGKYFSIKNGAARRSVVMAEDVALCIKNNIGKTGIYNLTDGYHPTFREIEKVIAGQLNKKMPKNLPAIAASLLGFFGDLFSFCPVNSTTIQKMSEDLIIDDKKAQDELNWNPNKIIDKFKIK